MKSSLLQSRRPLTALWFGLACLGPLLSVLALPEPPSSPAPVAAAPAGRDAPPPYQYRPAHPDGIGKIYLGREIARVMGHQGAAWLERPEREAEEQPDLLIDSLGLKSGDHVADIGAGTGYFSWRMAQAIGENGQVYAVDVQPEMLELLRGQMMKRGVENVRPVLGTEQTCQLEPDSVDLVLMVDVYHEFSHPYEMLESICRAVRPGGRVVFVEYRAEDPAVPIKALHKMSEAQVKREAAVHPLEHIETIGILPRQHIVIFERTVRR